MQQGVLCVYITEMLKRIAKYPTLCPYKPPFAPKMVEKEHYSNPTKYRAKTFSSSYSTYYITVTEKNDRNCQKLPHLAPTLSPGK